MALALSRLKFRNSVLFSVMIQLDFSNFGMGVAPKSSLIGLGGRNSVLLMVWDRYQLFNHKTEKHVPNTPEHKSTM